MKKFFLMTAFVASATMAMAQTTVSAPSVSGDMLKTKAPMGKVVRAEMMRNGVTGPKKTAATGNYFTRPAGSMYVGYTKEGAGYYPTLLNITPYVPATFTNMNADPTSATWYVNGEVVGANNLDENNNYVASYSGVYPFSNGGYYYYAPTLVKGSDSYEIPGGVNESAGVAFGTYIVTDSVSALTFQGPNVGSRLSGYSGFMSKQYLFGSGVANIEDGQTWTVYGVQEHFESPMTPLYVEDVFLTGLTGYGNTQALSNGAVLTMRIIEDNGETFTLTCEASDLISQGQQNTNWCGTATFWTVVFSQKTTDIFGNPTTEPFVIDDAFTVEITGFDNPNVDLGLFGFQPAAEDPIEAGFNLVRNQDGTTYPEFYPESEMPGIGYQGDLSFPVTFTALFDYVEVVATDGENNNLNVIRITDDGTACNIEGWSDAGAIVYTATQWYDEFMGENYTYNVVSASGDGSGDWIGGTTSSSREEWLEGNGMNIVGFTATPCPAGKGRWAVVNITGRGFTSATPVILLQGTATLDDVTTGIENAVVDNAADKGFDENAPIYNLNGQRVSKAAKGILIQDGRKFIRK